MAPELHWGQQTVFFLLLLPCQLAGGLVIIDHDAPKLTCSQGLSCRLRKDPPISCLSDYDSVKISHMKLTAALCGSSLKEYKPCLQINLTLNDMDLKKLGFEASGDDSDEEALVKVTLSTPGSTGVCRVIEFKLRNSHLRQGSESSSITLLLTEQVNFGSPVVVIAKAKETYEENIKFPGLVEVCPKMSNIIKECDVPRLEVQTENEKNVIRLQLKNDSFKKIISASKEICLQMIWDGSAAQNHSWPKGKKEMEVPLHLVAPCLCFQTWWKGEDIIMKDCPFVSEDAHNRLQHNVSVDVKPIEMRNGEPGLRWSVTSPCKVEAEVLLCKENMCEEVIQSKKIQQADWYPYGLHVQKTGEFNGSFHSSVCVQIKVNGIFLEPQCPFAAARARWILLLLLGLVLICLVSLGSYFIQGVLKGYVWRWLKEEDVKGAVGGGHVVLLYPSDDEGNGLPELLCHLGSSLQDLGFTVSLDLWSQAELGILGPVPWLHSRLDRLKRQGGKVVLVLTQATWTRAEEWEAQSFERNTPKEPNRHAEETKRGPAPSSHQVDVFGASLSCILADYLQGCAGKRFMLVQFESLPPKPPGGLRPLPQLFRGLHVHSLPSQSLNFLTELSGTRYMSSASAKRKRAGGLRIASRFLAQRLSKFTAGTNVLRLTGVSQGCVVVGEINPGETLLLKPDPFSSPDSSQ